MRSTVASVFIQRAKAVEKFQLESVLYVLGRLGRGRCVLNMRVFDAFLRMMQHFKMVLFYVDGSDGSGGCRHSP